MGKNGLLGKVHGRVCDGRSPDSQLFSASCGDLRMDQKVKQKQEIFGSRKAASPLSQPNFLPHIHFCPIVFGMGAWRNWHTRTPQKRMEQSLEVRILSRPLLIFDRFSVRFL